MPKTKMAYWHVMHSEVRCEWWGVGVQASTTVWAEKQRLIVVAFWSDRRSQTSYIIGNIHPIKNCEAETGISKQQKQTHQHIKTDEEKAS